MALADILKAAKDNDVKTMLALLQAGGDATEGNAIGQTALHIAAIWGNIQVAAVLLRVGGADVNATNQFGLTPFHGCVQGDHYDFAVMLVEAGANTHVRAANGRTAFDVAKSDKMRVLCGGKPLKGHAAVLASDQPALEALLTSGELDVSACDADGDTILHLAVSMTMGLPTGDNPAIEEISPVDQLSYGDPRATTVLECLLKYGNAKGFAKAQRTHNDEGMMPFHSARAARVSNPRPAASPEPPGGSAQPTKAAPESLCPSSH